MQKRKNCNHPDLIVGPFDGSTTFPEPEELVEQCGKFHLMDRIRDLFRRPIRMDDEDRYLSASIGVALFPDHVGDAQSLIASAEAALNQAAELSGTRYQFYNERLHERIRERMELHWGLHDALEQQRFHLRYQPQQDLALWFVFLLA